MGLIVNGVGRRSREKYAEEAAKSAGGQRVRRGR